MTAQPLPDDLLATGEWLVQAIDPRARLARLVKMNRAAFREASFLDDRLDMRQFDTRLCDLDELVAASGEVEGLPAGWIFHIGHVGSTLVSRLLGELDGVLALREPRSLRDLAVAEEAERPLLAQALAALMARREPLDQTIIVKATSFVSEYAPLLVGKGSPALFLYATPANYIAGILAGENSVKELAGLHDYRALRLASRGIGLPGFERDNAHRAAAAWACEMTSLEAAAEALADRRTLWADFDVMLGDMAGWLERCSRHFGLVASRERFEELAAGPLMRRYSKALEYDYSPLLRAELLAEAAQDHRADIETAMAALNQAAAAAPLLNQALERAGREF